MRPIDVELKEALGRGDLEECARLIATGANVRYVDENGYDALLAAVHGRDLLRDERLLELLRLLIRHGVRLDTLTPYKESALRVLAHVGRFDAVRLLLDAGADRSPLEWTPLHEAVATGTVSDVLRAIEAGADLEATDWWSRTAWLTAVTVGDLAKAELLRDRGADEGACGRCATPALFHAIESHRPAMVRWLLDGGHDLEQPDQFGRTPLFCAVDVGDAECVEILVAAGANVHVETAMGSLLGHAEQADIVQRLLDAGADPGRLSAAGHRALCGRAEGLEAFARVSAEEFARARTRRFGRSNPERIGEPFWEAMIRSGVSAYEGATIFDPSSPHAASPVWSALRFGQSITRLPDGRIVQVAGEHEDAYDEDFCIYNDVFVHEPGGAITLYGYPEDVFPPTDFHTATLLGDAIYLIGSLGYAGSRGYGHTPVFRLDTRTFRIERLAPAGDAPGWIYGHRAVAVNGALIRVWGGTLVTPRSGRDELHAANPDAFVLDLDRLRWSQA